MRREEINNDNTSWFLFVQQVANKSRNFKINIDNMKIILESMTRVK
jgi:hypothetical protein